LVRLRWGAILGQLTVMAVVDRLMGVALPWRSLSLVVAAELALNLACVGWLGRRRELRESHLASVVALDLLLFSILLHQTGGPANPFSFLYLVHIAIAALVLSPRFTWALVGLALACSAGLFLWHVPLPGDVHAGHHHHGADHGFDWHLRGMWVALGIAASLIVYFLHRVVAELHERESELLLVREQTARHERLASLATLAAGAAHELASPVASKELERGLARGQDAHSCMADVELIRAQVDRCRQILDQMAADAGQPVGEAAREFSPRELLAQALSGMSGADRVDFEAASAEPKLRGPSRALGQALRSLIKNALDASTGSSRVDVSASIESGCLRLEVRDRGPGMSPEIRERAIEPFFSTKPTGQGMGLGLFLARSVAEQVGGRLELESEPGRGTRAALILPMREDATICRIHSSEPPAPAFS
jgi:two-component system sensor histidine kinase RegB